MKAIRSLLFGAALLATSAMGQLGMPGMGGGMTMPSMEYNSILLMDPGVQKDMGVSPQVTAKIQSTLMQSLSKILPNMMGAMGGKKLSQSDQVAMGKQMIDVYADINKKVLVLLTPQQKVRLHQITLQTFGPAAILDPKVASELGLSANQKSLLSGKYAAVASANTASMKKVYDPSKGMDMSKAGDMMASFRAAQKKMRVGYLAAMNSVLTSSQKQKWVELQGKHVELGMIGQMVTGGMGG